MRYAICFTPPIGDPLSAVAASWLGRNVYSDEPTELPSVAGLSVSEIAFHTAVPRRFGFHAVVMAPFCLNPDTDETELLKALMHFAGAEAPLEIAGMEVARFSQCWGLVPQVPSQEMHLLAARVVQAFDRFRAPMSEDEIERCDPDRLTAPQFTNLHRWGDPYVMDEYRFHIKLTGALNPETARRMEAPLRELFQPHLERPLAIGSLALFVEQGPGAPMRVHSQHPLGKISARSRDGGAKRPVVESLAEGRAVAPIPFIMASLLAGR
ncbi:hypothetical protein ILFOPFJJ_01112 [Ensifer psoraleae]|uniref:DUF1045 domain-containing protein n=1 Tax=Sinorhizobium psoraleae TaxID=520838 RepID=UPI0015680801|nr:DUF1045 domain-containing protein [Sinorhizobium psoraleae]NRP70233.1 hypothetical protein [Sinorhizobium psoraleae]